MFAVRRNIKQCKNRERMYNANMKLKKSSFYVVFIQTVTLLYLVLSGPVFPTNLISFMLSILSVIIFILSFKELSKSKIGIVPEVKKGAVLINSGIYKLVRHPIYLALILFSTSLVINFSTSIRLIVFILFLVNLIIKIKIEEGYLAKAFPKYIKYKQKSNALIPKVY